MWNFLMKGGNVEISFGNLFKGGVCAWFEQTFQRLMGTIYQVLGLFADLMHIAFYILAGVDMKAGDNEYGMFDIQLISSGDRQNILDYFVFNEAVTKAYWILCGIGLLLIVIFTVYKIVKQDYFDRAGPRSKGPIFRNVAISAISFLLVIPIFYVIIHVSSLLAVAVMDAMGMNATTFAGAQIFQLSWDDNGEAMRTINAMLMNHGNGTTKYSASTFKWMLELDNDTIFVLMATDPSYVNHAPGLVEALGGNYDGGVLTASLKPVGDATFYWYIYIVGIVVAIKSLYKLLQAMLQRIFKILGLFIVAPSPISQYVLDDGTKFNSWLKQSIQEGLRLVVATMSFSIFLMVLKLVSDINFITPFQNAADAATQAESINVSTSLLAYNEEFANIPMLDATPSSNGSNGLESMFYSLANAFMQVFIIMGAGGAITDLDPVLSGLISGAGSSLEAGKTGEAAGAVGKAAAGLATRAAGAAVGGALSLAKGAAGLAVGGVAAAVKGGLEGSKSQLEEATKEDASSSDDKEETSTATVEGDNAVNSQNATDNVNEDNSVTEGNAANPSDDATQNADAENAEEQASEQQNGASGEDAQSTANNGGEAGQNSAANANDAGTPNAASKKSAANNGVPNIGSKRQARLERRNKALKIGHLAKSGLKRTFGVAGGFLKALNLKQALVDSNLISKDMVESFGAARTTAQSAMDNNVVKDAVGLAKTGIAKKSQARGAAKEQKRMDKEIESTDIAKQHNIAMENVNEKTQELNTANERVKADSEKVERQALQYAELSEAKNVAETKANDAEAKAKSNYESKNKDATVDQKEKLSKYINGEISDEEAGEDLKAFKAAGADKARTAREDAKRAADLAENGEYEYDHDLGRNVLVRAGRKDYENSVAQKNKSIDRATRKMGELNTAVHYANGTSKAYNDLYKSTKTRGHYVSKDGKTGEEKVGVGDVSKGKLGENNSKLAAANKMIGSSVAPSKLGTKEEMTKQIEKLRAENAADQQLKAKYDTQITQINTDFEDAVSGMTYSYTDDDNNVVKTAPSSNITQRLEKNQKKSLKKVKKARDKELGSVEEVDNRIAQRDKEIDKLERAIGFSTPEAVIGKLNENKSSAYAYYKKLNDETASYEKAHEEANEAYNLNRTEENNNRRISARMDLDQHTRKVSEAKAKYDSFDAAKSTLETIKNETPEKLKLKQEGLYKSNADLSYEDKALSDKYDALERKKLSTYEKDAKCLEAYDEQSKIKAENIHKKGQGKNPGVEASSKMESLRKEHKSYQKEIDNFEKEQAEIVSKRNSIKKQIDANDAGIVELDKRSRDYKANVEQAAAIGASLAGYNYTPQRDSKAQPSAVTKEEVSKKVVSVKTEEETTKVAESGTSTKSETVFTSGVRERKSDEKGVKIDRGEWSEGAKVMADEISDAVASAAKKVLSGEKGAGSDVGVRSASDISNINQNVTITDASRGSELKGPNSDNKYEEEDHILTKDIKAQVDKIEEEVKEDK